MHFFEGLKIDFVNGCFQSSNFLGCKKTFLYGGSVFLRVLFFEMRFGVFLSVPFAHRSKGVSAGCCFGCVSLCCVIFYFKLLKGGGKEIDKIGGEEKGITQET